jgi:hypothetical protein
MNKMTLLSAESEESVIIDFFEMQFIEVVGTGKNRKEYCSDRIIKSVTENDVMQYYRDKGWKVEYMHDVIMHDIMDKGLFHTTRTSDFVIDGTPDIRVSKGEINKLIEIKIGLNSGQIRIKQILFAYEYHKRTGKRVLFVLVNQRNHVKDYFTRLRNDDYPY